MNLTQRTQGGLLAMACGDALANGAEFYPRGSYQISDMNSAERYLPIGQWSDDTGMALCLGESLLERQGFDAHDQMSRYVAFFNPSEGWPNNKPLTPGKTIAQALQQFQRTDDPYAGSDHPLSAGNGGLMRLLPVALAAHADEQLCRQWAIDSTRTTHASKECLEASELLALIFIKILAGADKETALQAGSKETWSKPKINALAAAEYLSKNIELIKAKAYVVDTLEAALWCFSTTDTLESALLTAANLGDDCDTVAAITGQLAGCYYGVQAIPTDWLDVLAERERIETLALQLLTIKQAD